MSAEYCVLYYGIREPIQFEEVEELDWDDSSLARKAERAGLNYRQGNFSYKGEEEYYLFVGHEIGVFGWEDQLEKKIEDRELLEIMSNTRSKLKALGVEEEPALYIQWGPDF